MSKKPPPLISTVIVNYNSGPFLKDAVESAIRQTGVRTEIIIVDNASSDDSLAQLG